MRSAVLFLALVMTTDVGLASDPDVIRLDEARNKHLLLYSPRPEYPLQSRALGVVGKGDFLLRFDYDTGHVKEVHIVKSTGSLLLDKSTIDSLRQWKAKPRSIHQLFVPIGFAMRGRSP